MILFLVNIVSVYAGDNEFEIVLQNKTEKTLVLQNVRDNYTNISNPNIGEGFEVPPNTNLSFRSFILPIRYYNNHEIADEIKFSFLDDCKDEVPNLNMFEILWDQKAAFIGRLKDWNGYQLSSENQKNSERKYIFTVHE